MKKIIVIGGGAAGMMAAIAAAEAEPENTVLLLEKNDKLGKKLFITGKGRCNLTNAGDDERFFQSVTTNSKFMYSSFYTFSNKDTIAFFEKLGLKTKVERGERVFPESNHSSDVIGVLKTKLNRLQNLEVMLQTEVSELLIEEQTIKGVIVKGGRTLKADAVIVATGGISYPLTGSTGDGYRFAGQAGHSVKPPVPSLVPFVLNDNFCKELMGLSLKNVMLSIKAGKKRIFEEQGELLFTHFGISGPLVIKASAYIHKYLDKDLMMYIDLKPALTCDMLDERILRDFKTYANKDFHNALGELLPIKLIPVIVERSGIDAYKKVHSITKEERSRLIQCIKQFAVSFQGLRGFDEAIITKGGVAVKEICPSTMESKLVKNLYFAGEVLDVDALTGGFNLQVAWSTGHLAGISCGEESVEPENIF